MNMSHLTKQTTPWTTWSQSHSMYTIVFFFYIKQMSMITLYCSSNCPSAEEEKLKKYFPFFCDTCSHCWRKSSILMIVLQSAIEIDKYKNVITASEHKYSSWAAFKSPFCFSPHSYLLIVYTKLQCFWLGGADENGRLILYKDPTNVVEQFNHT